jgi:cbb3-type cytochrome oxidase maturation protein
MESLYLLIPLSAGLVLLILAVFGWALHRGQFEELEREGERILAEDRQPGASSQVAVDTDQSGTGTRREESVHS